MLTEMSDDVRNRPFGQYQVAATSDHDEACAALESVFQPRRLRLEKTASTAAAQCYQGRRVVITETATA